MPELPVSVIVPTYSMERYPDLTACIDSISAQTYPEIEIIVTVDGNEQLTERLQRKYVSSDDIRIVSNGQNAGPISRANLGAICATGELVVLTDDDAVAETDWIERLVEAYRRHDAVAVGGKIVPEWVAGEATHIPAEFYFLIGAASRGVGPDGDREQAGEIRNGMGSNLAVRAETFEALGGFEPTVGGRKGDKQMQGGETELCIRLADEFGEGVWYVPDALVEHRIYEYRTDSVWLLKRAFWQGVSKRGMARFVPESSSDETAFLRRLVGEYLPERVRGLVSEPTSAKLQQFVMLLVLTFATGLGYLYGYYHWR